jgi:hypothetical protein
MSQKTVTYYPGQKDYNGNIVPDGYEEVFEFTYSLSLCNG